MEALDLWVRCRRRLFFFRKMAPRFPDAAGGAGAAGRTLRSQPDPSPNAPRDQIRRKGPCCDPVDLATSTGYTAMMWASKAGTARSCRDITLLQSDGCLNIVLTTETMCDF